MVEPSTTLEAPEPVMKTYRDALGLLRQTAKNYEYDDNVTKDAATELRRELGNQTGWERGEVDLIPPQLTLLWSAVTVLLFQGQKRDDPSMTRRAKVAGDYLDDATPQLRRNDY